MAHLGLYSHKKPPLEHASNIGYNTDMSTTLTIPLAKKEQERLSRLALRFGMSLPELSGRILKEVASEIPAESFDEYSDATKLRSSFRRALRDWRMGNVHTRL